MGVRQNERHCADRAGQRLHCRPAGRPAGRSVTDVPHLGASRRPLAGRHLLHSDELQSE